VVISPKSDDDRQNFQRALSDLAQEDPSITIKTESLDSQTTISGMGELHLEVICDRIVRDYKVGIDVGEPKVLYLETIREHAEAEGKYIRQTGGRGQYAHVKLKVEPREPGSGYQFVDEIKAGAVPPEFVEPVNLGIQEAMRAGVLAGHEMVDLRAVLYDGSYHLEDSNEMTFQIAGSIALKEAARKASPVLLEPMMAVEVVIPEDYAGVIMGDVSSRRGRIEGMEHRAGSQVINAIAPLLKLSVMRRTCVRSLKGGPSIPRTLHATNRLLVAASLELIRQESPRTNPKAQPHGAASLPPSRTHNRSDREFSVAAVHHI
jgi:elongation factor G